eukprot:4714971-Pleurochrysis_carterae.AAC.1
MGADCQNGGAALGLLASSIFWTKSMEVIMPGELSATYFLLKAAVTGCPPSKGHLDPSNKTLECTFDEFVETLVRVAVKTRPGSEQGAQKRRKETFDAHNGGVVHELVATIDEFLRGFYAATDRHFPGQVLPLVQNQSNRARIRATLSIPFASLARWKSTRLLMDSQSELDPLLDGGQFAYVAHLLRACRTKILPNLDASLPPRHCHFFCWSQSSHKASPAFSLF